jgi:hypothetical protein
MEKMMHDKLTQFIYVTRKKYGTDSYSAGYLMSLVDEMVREMRIRGSDERTTTSEPSPRLSFTTALRRMCNDHLQ